MLELAHDVDAARVAFHVGAPGALPQGFTELAALVYRDDPRRIPEEPAAIQRAFGPANPWFERGEARLWCAPGLARAAAFFHPDARVEDDPVAFFGCWETSAPGAVDRALFQEIEAWARARGAASLVGPVDFSTAGTYRLAVDRMAAASPRRPPDRRSRIGAPRDDFVVDRERDVLPFPGEPYNPPDYAHRLATLGFEVRRRYVTFEAGREVVAAARSAVGPIRDAILAKGYRIESLTPARWLGRLDELHPLVNDIFADNYAYTPLDRATFDAVCGASFIRKACPIASVIAYAPEGSIAGFFLCFPDYGPLLVQGAGPDRIPASQVAYDTHMPLLRRRGAVTGIGKTVGVAPRHRRHGLYEALWLSLLERGNAIYSRWIGALVREDNHTRRPLDRVGRITRRYALYGKTL